MGEATAHEILRLNTELSQSQAREMSWRREVTTLTTTTSLGQFREAMQAIEALLASPATGWPAEVVVLLKAGKSARIGLIAVRDLGIISAPNPLPALEQAIAFFERVE